MPHKKIESIVQSRVNQNLESKGLSHLNAEVDGLDVTLSGNVSSDDEAKAAVEACKVCGNNSVDDSGLVTINLDKYNVIGMHSDKPSNIILSGIVPNQDVKKAIINEASRIYGQGNITDQLVFDTFFSDQVKVFNTLAVAAIKPLRDFSGDSSFNMSFSRTIYSGKYFNSDLSNDTRLSLVKYKQDYEVQFPEVSIAPVTSTTLMAISPPSTQPVEKVNCQKKINDLLRGEKILFKTSSYQINSKSKLLLGSLAKALKECPAYRVEVGGHTDRRGKAAFNLLLSKQRAGSVKSRLIQLGVSKLRVKAIGYGELQPLVEGNTPADLAKNRRIEIKLQGEL